MTETLLIPPPIPSKYDIIPVHASDMASFQRCRRYWSWASPARNNLRRRVGLYGINMNLWFGSGIHYALEKYYSPTLQRDPVEVFSSWFELQWNGGLIFESDLEITYDLNPVVVGGELGIGKLEGRGIQYRIKGLRDLLADPFEDEFLEFRDLGIGMMEFYKEYAKREDDFECVAAESSFSIPLEFEAVEIREQSPNYGKKLEVHLRGKRDAIIHYPDRKNPLLQYAVHDYKTAAKVDEDYFLKLENDPQCTTYVVATVKEAEQHDLPWTTVQEVLYTALRKVYPKPPNLTSRGFPSLDRSKESTTAQMFNECIQNEGLVDWFHNDEKAQNYYDYLLAEGDKVFIQRDQAIRNPHQIKVAYEELQMVAKEMLNPKVHVYKHPSGMSYCTRCAFRAPCLAVDDGSDWQGMLAQDYELNRGR